MILGSRHCLQGFIPPSKLFLDLRFRSKLGNKQPHSYQKYGIFVCHIWNSILAHYYENFNPTELKLSSSMWSMIFCVFVAVKLQFSEKWREIWLLEVVFLVVLNSIIGIPLYLPYLIWWFRAIIIQSYIILSLSMFNFVIHLLIMPREARWCISSVWKTPAVRVSVSVRGCDIVPPLMHKSKRLNIYSRRAFR